MKTLLSLALLVLSLSGCVTQTPAAKEVLPTAQTFAAPKSVVWPLLVQEVGLQYPVKAVEKDSGLLTTDFVTIPAGFNNAQMNKWILPPGGFMTTWDGLRVSLSILVSEVEPSKTRVTIRAQYHAFENNVAKSWIICQSNGSLENGILTRIAEQMPK